MESNSSSKQTRKEREQRKTEKGENRKEKMGIVDKLSDLKFVDDDPVVIVVGPEGGMSEAELAQLSGNEVRMGQEVLRSAHAGFAALAAIQTLIRRW